MRIHSVLLGISRCFGVEDHTLTENPYKFNGYGAKMLVRVFPDTGLDLHCLRKKLCQSAMRTVSQCTDTIIDTVSDLVQRRVK